MRTAVTARSVASSSKQSRGPRLGRPKGRFTQHRRLDRLRELLESAPLGLTLEEIATTLRMTQRSVRRYLRELDGTKPEEKFELLEFVETRKGGPLRWRIKPGERGRAVSLRRAQAYALLSTRRALDILRGSALYDEADLALAQIAKVAQTPFRASGRAEISGEQHLEDRFFFVPAPCRSYAARGEDLDELFRAVADLRVLRYRPRTRAGEPKAERVTFYPYAMVVHQGAIVLLGARPGAPAAAIGSSSSSSSSASSRKVEVLPLERMTEIRTSETEHFELPDSFDVAAYVHGDLGIGPTSGTTAAGGRFIVEFEARIADEIKTRRIHAEQRIATAPDGRVRMSLPLIDPRAAIAFVLSYGDAARVVEPPDLAAMVGNILSRAASRYGNTTP
jgi:predicted DNA-binding transcriptional regulator YafY